jgi:hypothetical protein
MTVQPQADQPSAETGADLQSDTDRLKTGGTSISDHKVREG